MVDLSDLISEGVFADLKDEDKFAGVRLASSRRSLEWDGEIDLCADALYLRLTGKTAQDLFPALAREEARA